MADPLSITTSIIAIMTVLEKGGKEIVGLVRAYGNAPQTVDDFRLFGIQLYEGQLRDDFSMLQLALKQDSVPAFMKKILHQDFQELDNKVKKARELLIEYSDENKKVREMFRRMFADGDLKRCVRGLESCQEQISSHLQMIKNHQITTDRVMSLELSNFQEISTLESQLGRQLAASNISAETVGVKDFGYWRTVSVIRQERLYVPYDDWDTIIEATSKLASDLSEAEPGILKCLGYRGNPQLELIFELPAEFDQGSTLWTALSGDLIDGFGGPKNLQHRLQLARQLSEAILSVHAKELVHKNIRSNTILLLKCPDTVGLGHLYLTDWTVIRAAGGISVKNRNDGWEEDIYKHPLRQMIGPIPCGPVTRYNMGHDIYSLGVCLLEIGLWEPLIVKCNSDLNTQASKCLSHRFAQKAVDLGCMEESQKGSSKRVLDRKDVQKVIIAMAQDYLPLEMGPLYTEVVLSCLNCLENGLGDSRKDFQDHEAAGISYKAVVMRPLSSIVV